MTSILIFAAVVLVVCVALYVRFAPAQAADWHVDLLAVQDPGRSGVLHRVAVDASASDAMRGFEARILALPRSRILAGSADEGHVTYEIRSALWRFPDYVTVQAVSEGADADLVILSRLRFGQSDLGVNAARLERLLGGWTVRR